MDAVLVISPHVLGDTYDEVMGNPNKLADAKFALVIVPPSHRAKMN